MKIIEGMKEIKRLEEKADDLRAKVATYCADMDMELPTYPDQAGQIAEWIQSAHDSYKEAERLRLAIQKTNLSKLVTIEINGKKIEKSIAAWIVRRRLYSVKEQGLWAALTDKGLKDATWKNTTGEMKPIHVRRHYDPKVRDAKVSEYREEPNLIDRSLEVVNAVTDLIE